MDGKYGVFPYTPGFTRILSHPRNVRHFVLSLHSTTVTLQRRTTPKDSTRDRSPTGRYGYVGSDTGDVSEGRVEKTREKKATEENRTWMERKRDVHGGGVYDMFSFNW